MTKEFIIHVQATAVGRMASIMHPEGISFLSMYWYYDDEETVYFANLDVNPLERRAGQATKILAFAESEASSLGFKKATLLVSWCGENKWVHDWYEKQGYSNIAAHETEPNAVWMEKKLD